MGIQTHFDKFHDRIKLGRQDDAYKKARERDDSIKADVKTAFSEAGYPVVADFIQGVFRRIGGQNGGLVGHRQTHSVPVCSPPSRRFAPLRPRCAGLTAWTPAARTSVPVLV